MFCFVLLYSAAAARATKLKPVELDDGTITTSAQQSGKID
jgi:hypothetical protein